VYVPAMLVQQVALVLAPVLFIRLKYRESLPALWLPRLDRREYRLLLLGMGLALLLLPVSDGLESAARWWLIDSRQLPPSHWLRVLEREANALNLLKELRAAPGALAVLAVVVGWIGPVAEEIFFRGFAYRIFRERFGVRAGVLLSAALFALIHLNPVALVPIFVMGIMLAWLYERTGSLAAPVGMHVANNVLALLFYFLAPDFSLWKH
jgi:membrane protease YdiL (CAAX protease family)